MLDALKQSINDLQKVDRPRLEDECDALFSRIEQARSKGSVTDEQATQLIHDVRNERSRCFRSASQRLIEDSQVDGRSCES
jgi:isopropylmalate/homocitrate/citramalate synthase